MVTFDISDKVTPQDLFECATMYVSQLETTFAPGNVEVTFRCLEKHREQGDFYRILRKDGKIRAGILGVVGPLDHTSYPVLMMRHYFSNLKGIPAVRAVAVAHGELMKYGIQRKVPLIISQSGPLDQTNQLARILKKEGWELNGHVAHVRTGLGSMKARTLGDVGRSRGITSRA